MRALIVSCVALVAGCKGIKDYDQPPDVQPPGTTYTNTLPPPDCAAYEFQGNTYDCNALDRCDMAAENLTYRLACCDCDPALCNPDPTCPPDENYIPPVDTAESCMSCHNGSAANDYYGTGISNPHPFAGAAYVKCTTCHGGNGAGGGKNDSHVPPPPQIGDDQLLQTDAYAYFNFLTRVGLDKLPSYTANGVTYTGMDYLQFMNPGDTRVVDSGKSCGTTGCHGGEHQEWFSRGPINTEVGFYSATMYSIGAPNKMGYTYYSDTASDAAYRAVSDPTWVYDPDEVGRVGALVEMPDFATYGDTTGVYRNPVYDSNILANFREANDPEYINRVLPNSPLEHLVSEAVVFFCGDCHAGSSGANNRYADFRSSGCTSCHMQYSLDGRSRSTDPNVNKYEPANPDAIAAPERPHVDSHQIRNVAKLLPNGAFVRGVSDNACVGCHQGSNRTVLQYWGIRLDQNQDLVNNFQYPANPVTFVNTAADTRLYDPVVANNTFNGRNANQYILFEDYDGDGRDDTPEDVHYEAGMGCIDCHGSRDVHNGTEGDADSGKIWSRQDQTVKIQCVSCHGTVESYAYTSSCTDYTGGAAECATDRAGNAVRNVTKDAAGNYWLTSRLDGLRHFVPQTRDSVINSNKVHPLNGQLLYSPLASYAMGRADGSVTTGVGPMQTDPYLYDQGFSHMDKVACDACHASWSNNCVGCHIQMQYNDNPANYFFSNTTGDRISIQGTNADFTYISPVFFGLEVGSRGEVSAGQPGMKMFFRYVDLNGNLAAGLTFSDRNGNGNNPNYAGRGQFPALSHNRIYAHSIRGKVNAQDEGARQCVACHLNQDQIDNFGADYAVYFDDMENRNYANLDFNLLQQHIGQNPGNQLNSPYFVHMASGLGTGLLLFDQFGCPVNPLDANANRQYCVNGAPADNFDLNNVAYDLDKTVEITGVSNSSHTHPFIDNLIQGVELRTGAIDPGLSGPIGSLLLQKLANPNGGLVLDSWVDANGNAQGNAANFIQ